MELEIITESPAWLSILCFMAGGFASWFLYRRDKILSGVTKWSIWLMAVFRFLSISIICLLLLSPLFKSVIRDIQKPVIALVIDDSKSIPQGLDSAVLSKRIMEQVADFEQRLSESCDVRVFSTSDRFSEGFDGSFKGLESDLSAAVEELQTRFAGLNLSAVALVSDGLYNKGVDPVYAYSKLSVPIYTVGLGDTTVRKDAFIQSVRYNSKVFLGNSFPIEITLNARELQGQKGKLKLTHKGNVISEKEFDISSSRFSNLVTFIVEGKEKGLMQYELKLDPLNGEENLSNNQRTIFIEITSDRSKVMLVHAAPHPDVAAIRGLMESNPNYELIVGDFSNWNGPVPNCKLAILHQIPGKGNVGKAIVESIQKAGIPIMFILGSSTSIADINALSLPIRVEDHNGSTTEALPTMVNTFSLFKIDDPLVDRINKFPPLSVPFGNYNFRTESYSLFTQTIGNTRTDMPLISFSPNSSPKIAFIMGEGLWKWRLSEFQSHGANEAFSAIILKSIQYMVSNENKNPFRLTYKNSYEENEPVTLDATVYNDAGENIKDAEVSIVFTDSKANNYSYAFSNNNGLHTLNAGFLAPGIYSFKATAKAGDRSFFEQGKIVVTSLQSELADLVADHNLLRSLSIKTGGMFMKNDLNGVIIDSILSKKDVKPVIYSKKSLSESINLKWIFFLLISLLSAEWFMRKRSGGY